MLPGIWMGSRSHVVRSTSRCMNTVPRRRASEREGGVGGLDDFGHVNRRQTVEMIDEGRPVAAAFDLARQMTGAVRAVEPEGLGGLYQQRSAQGGAFQNVGDAEAVFAG